MDKHKKVEGLKVLVTGGAGFCGSNLCEFLVNSGAIVTCLDNFQAVIIVILNYFQIMKFQIN